MESITPEIIKTEALTIEDSLNNRNIATITVSSEQGSNLRRILTAHAEANQFYDVNTTWCLSERLTLIVLEVHFPKPKDLIINIVFDPNEHCETIDLIRFNARFTLLAISDDDNGSPPDGAMIEVHPDSAFDEWDDLYVHIIRKRYEKDEGVHRSESKELAKKGIAFLRKQWLGTDLPNQ